MGERLVLERLQNTMGSIVLFGASTAGRKICNLLKRNSVSSHHIVFCDNYKRGVEPITNTIIISPKDLFGTHKSRYENAIICICVMSPALHEEVYTQLMNLGFSSDQIISYPELVTAFTAEYDPHWDDMEDSYDWTQNQCWIAEMAKWIDEDDHSVIDYGAGACYLKECLRPNMIYLPTDYIARSAKTVVFDFNKDPFPDISADVGFLGFALQQAKDWQALLHSVCHASKRKVIIGNAIYNQDSGVPLLTGGITRFYSEEPIIKSMEKEGFSLLNKKFGKWGDGLVCRSAMLLFKKSKLSSTE